MKVFVTVPTLKETTAYGWFIGIKLANASFKILRCEIIRFKNIKNRLINSCHFPYKGPCDVGQWFLLKDVPTCELIPEGCPADGDHVYGNIGTSDNTLGSKCWKIGSPCSKLNRNGLSFPSSGTKVMQVEQSEDGNLRIFCDVKNNYVKATSESSLGYKPSCSPGTYRNRFDKCIRGLFG